MTMLKQTLITLMIAAMVWGTASAQTCDGSGSKGGNASVGKGGRGSQQHGNAQRRGQGRRACGQGRGTGQGENGQCTLIQDMGSISDVEAERVIYMRQEEKLARDVYLTLSATWDSVVFGRIANSEQKHADAMARVIAVQGMTDPVSDEAAGVYANPVFAATYTDLTEAGQVSYAEALNTGAYIEELDILDLQATLNAVENEQLQRIFENLMQGSYNHLRAFVSLLAQEGQTYVPKLMTTEQYNEILSAPTERGQGQGRGQGRGRGRGMGTRCGNGCGQCVQG